MNVKKTYKELKSKPGFKPGDLMNAAYMAKEAKEKPHAKMNKAEKKHEAKESKKHEAKEHKAIPKKLIKGAL